MRFTARQFVADVREIEGYPRGADDDALPERLRAAAEEVRRARACPPLTADQLATVASLLGMRVRLTDNDGGPE
jgi:hypothetical protein